MKTLIKRSKKLDEEQRLQKAGRGRDSKGHDEGEEEEVEDGRPPWDTQDENLDL